MKRILPVLGVLALALAGPTLAKDLTRAEVCGESGCAALPRDENGDGLVQLRGSEGRAVVAAPMAAPYFRLNWEFARRVHATTLYVPSVDLIAAQGMSPGSVEWFGASEAVLDKVRKSIHGLEPFAAPYGWKASLLEAAQPTQAAPAAERRDWTRSVLAVAGALVLLAATAFFSRRLRIRRLRAA